MKHRLSISILLLAAISPASAQLVSSHAATAAVAPQPAATATANTASQVVLKPVARVNGTVLTDRDLLREEYAIFPYARQHNGGIPKGMEPDIRAGAMKMIVFEELVYQEALRQKLTVPPAKFQTRPGSLPQTVFDPATVSRAAECRVQRFAEVAASQDRAVVAD